MFTTWEQVQDWIVDNNFARWIFYKNNPEGKEIDKANDRIVDSNAFPSDKQDKLEMTKKYLTGHAYGIGFRTPSTSSGGTVCEVRIDTYAQPTNGVASVSAPQFDENKLRESIRRELEAEWDKREYKRLRDELDRDRKAFEAEKNSAIGLLTNYLAPVGKALFASRGRVAGVDAKEDVRAARIIPQEQEQEIEQAQEQEPQEEIFTEEESDKLFELMARFKKAEPDYLVMLEKVVVMAENGDSAYKMAKGVLMQ